MLKMFTIDIPLLAWCLAGATVVMAALTAGLLVPRLLRVGRRVAEDTASVEAGECAGEPAVSVIVTADDDAANLAVLLPQLLGQDYGGPMEVIVVDNGEGSPAETVVARLQGDHPNLYLTYAPAHSRNISRKKLAVTIGVKAARYDCLLFTCGNCRIASPLWLRAMARHFAAGADVVAGYSVPLPAAVEDGAGARGESRRAAFDRVRGAVQWLVPAMKGRLWRADGNNMGYRRDLFYANKGFQRSLNLKYGDDDIFMSEISRNRDVAVELSRQSMVEQRVNDMARAHRLSRIHRDFTARYLNGASRRLWGLMSWMWLGCLGCGVAAAAVGLPSLLPAIAVVVIWVAMAAAAGTAWRRCSAALMSRRLCVTVAWFMTVHPLYTLAYKIRGRRARATNFTWTTEK